MELTNTETIINHTRIGNVMINLDSGLYFNISDNLNIQQYKKLGRRESSLLELLLNNSNRIVEKEFIVNSVWLNRVVTDSSLNVTVHNLRKFIISASSEIIIKNFSGIGYVLYKNKK